MSSFGLSSQRRRLALTIGGALAAAVVAAPAASAQFTLAACQGGAAAGQGSSFQASAFEGFKGVFSTVNSGCGPAAGANIKYTGTSSGAGRIALGQYDAATNPRDERDANYRWAGADEAPNPTQRAQMETGPLDANNQDVTAADNAKLHIIPVAIGSIAIIVHLPDGCDTFGSGAALYSDRPRVTLAALEAAFYGENSPTWGSLMPQLTAGAACADLPITRAVRSDSSGSTFAVKQLLARINPLHAGTWATSDNIVWPNPTTNLARPATTGGGALANLVRDNAGYLGYVDLATARKTAAATGQTSGSPYLYDGAATPIDRTFWLPLPQSASTPNYSDPQLDPVGYKTGATTRGANCQVTPAGVPTTPADQTYGNWTTADSTLTGAGYAGCTLTYEMVWQDNAVAYCASPEEEAKARTIKDYLSRAVLSAAGQDSLLANDYDRLPANIRTIAQAGVDAITWNQGGAGRPCSTEQPPPGPTPTPTGPGTAPPPPPAPISNAITVPSSRVSGTSIKLSLQLPGAGKISIASSTKPKKGKTIKLSTKTLTIAKAGTQAVTVSLSSKAKSALKKDKKLKITLKITYTPAGGVAKTITKTVTVKQPKAKAKKKGK